MPKRSQIATVEYLKQVPLPQHATSYTVITHETVIVNALEQLKLKGFEVENERYRANSSGEVAIGQYQLKYKNDPELGMMFAWANSYDRSMRFKCAVGGFVRVSESSIISADFSWGRKHTGTADQEMIAQVNNQIINAHVYYEDILKVKEEMKGMIVDNKEMAEFLGRAYFQKQLFSKEQIGIVRDEILKPSFDYSSLPNSLWAQYNHMLVALKKAHPRTWLDEQRDLHRYVCTEFGITSKPTLVPAPVAPTAGITDIITTTASIGEPITITVEPNDGPISIVSQSLVLDLTPEGEKVLEEAFKEELVTGKTKIHVTEEMFNTEVPIMAPNHIMGVPNEPVKEEPSYTDVLNAALSDDAVTPEQQKQIDAAIANLEKIEIKIPNLNLPD